MKTKIYLLLLGVLSLFVSKAQNTFPVNNESGKAEVVNIIENLDKNQKELFQLAKIYIVNTFKSANNVIQYENEEEGKIICKGNFSINSTGLGAGGTIHPKQAGIVEFTLEISIKDNRSRIRFYDISHKADYSGGNLSNEIPNCGTFSMMKKTWASIQEQALFSINNLIKQYEEALLNEASSGDDW